MAGLGGLGKVLSSAAQGYASGIEKRRELDYIEKQRQQADEDRTQQREARGLRINADQMTIEQAKKKQEREAIQQGFMDSMFQLKTANDPKPYVQWRNATFPDPIDDLTVNPDGSLTSRKGDQKKSFKNFEQFFQEASMFVHPKSIEKLFEQNDKAQKYVTDENGNLLAVTGNSATPVQKPGGLPVRGNIGGEGKSGSTEALIDRISAEFGVPWDEAYEIFKTSPDNPTERKRKMLMGLVDSDQKNFIERSDAERWQAVLEMDRLISNGYTGGISTRYRQRNRTPGAPAPTQQPDSVRSAIFGRGLDLSGGVGPVQSMEPLPPAEDETRDVEMLAENDGPVEIANDDDYARLPPGTLFVAPDGKVRKKPAPQGYANGGLVVAKRGDDRPRLNRMQRQAVRAKKPPSGGFNPNIDRKWRDDNMAVQTGEMTEQDFNAKWGVDG